MARDAYTRHKRQVDELLRAIVAEVPEIWGEPVPASEVDLHHRWEAYTDEHAKAIWASLFELFNNPTTPPHVAARAKVA